MSILAKAKINEPKCNKEVSKYSLDKIISLDETSILKETKKI